jgi:hypothetical protein
MAGFPVMKQIARLTAPENGAERSRYRLNVVVVYEDAATHEWGREVLGRVRNLAGEESVYCTWWNVADFSEPAVLAGAVSTAIRADVIVAAVREAEQMRLPFYVWVESWLPNRAARAGALVALIGQGDEEGGQPDKTSSYFQAIAREGRLDCLIERRKLSAQAPDHSLQRIITRGLARIESV